MLTASIFLIALILILLSYLIYNLYCDVSSLKLSVKTIQCKCGQTEGELEDDEVSEVTEILDDELVEDNLNCSFELNDCEANECLFKDEVAEVAEVAEEPKVEEIIKIKPKRKQKKSKLSEEIFPEPETLNEV